MVSVVIGVFNKEKYIGPAIRSVLNQSFGDFEMLIMDDGSTDAGWAIVEGIQDARIRRFSMPANSGLPAIPRNWMMRKAQGEYIAFLDADDRWLGSKLQCQLDFMQAHPEFPLTHTGCFVIDSAGNRQGIRHAGAVPPSGEYLRGLLKHCWICLSTVMLRRTLLEEIGYFNESPEYLTGEDWEFFWRVARQHPIGFLEEPLAEYRKHDANICKIGWNWRGTPRDCLTLNRIYNRTDLWRDSVPAAEMRQAILAAADENAHYWRGCGRRGRAAWFAWQMLKKDPMNAQAWRHLAAAGLRGG